MQVQILSKKSGARREMDNLKQIALDQPSVVFLKLAPENVARYDRRGDDLVLVLKDGQEIIIPRFFVKYPESQTDALANDDQAADGSAQDDASRNELVLIDDNNVIWWGQYPQEWSEFHFTEIDGDFAPAAAWWPLLLVALGGLGTAAIVFGGGGKISPLVALDDRASGTEDGGPVTGSVLANDTPGSKIAVTGFTIGTDSYQAGDTAVIDGVGSFTLNPDGQYIFTPDANWNGIVPPISYQIGDNHKQTATAELKIIITPVPDLTAENDAETTPEDTSVTSTVAGNDSTLSGGDLEYSKHSDPTNGTVDLNPDGSYTYTPKPNFNGTDSFQYLVTDAASGESAIRTVTIVITPENDAPEAISPLADRVSADGDLVFWPADTLFRDIDLEGNFDGDILTYSAVGLPDGLSIHPNTGVISGLIDNSASVQGEFPFVITVTDAAGASASVDAIWSVFNPEPVALNDYTSGDEDEVLTGNVLTGDADGGGADSDPDGDDLTVTGFTYDGEVYAVDAVVVDSDRGTFTMGSDGSYRFEPKPNWHGSLPDISYDISDGEGGSSTANLIITIDPVNDDPVADAILAEVTEAGIQPNSQGDLANDNQPLAGATTATGNVLEVASDVDGDTLEVSAVRAGDVDGILGEAVQGVYGTLTVGADGQFTYSLDNASSATEALGAGAQADDIFTVTISDGQGGTVETTVTIRVNGTNDQPTIDIDLSALTGAVQEAGAAGDGKGSVSGTLLANDPDAEAVQTWALLDEDAEVTTITGIYGDIRIDAATGVWTYELDNDRPATQALNIDTPVSETFEVVVKDGLGGSDRQTLTVSITGANDILTGSGDAALTVVEDQNLAGEAVPSGARFVGSLQDYVQDSDNAAAVDSAYVSGPSGPINITLGQPLTLTDVDDVPYATLTLQGDGSYVLQTIPHYSGDLPTLTYVMREGGAAGTLVEQNLDFSITPVSDAPTMQADKALETAEDMAVALDLRAPVIVDIGTSAATNDFPERLGLITLTLAGDDADGAIVSVGGRDLVANNGVIEILLVTDDNGTAVMDPIHHNGLTTASAPNLLTRAEYELLTLLPKPNSGANVTVAVSATSYEVDGEGVILTDVAGATSTQNVTIDVQAVTDKASLTWPIPAPVPPADPFVVDEDAVLNITSLVVPIPSADSDGSEEYRYSVSGLPIGSVVHFGSAKYTVSGSQLAPTAGWQDGLAPPQITIKPPANFSGDLSNVVVTLETRDVDSDSADHTPTIESSTIEFAIKVMPKAGDVAVADVTTNEDTAVAFLAGVSVTDTDGSEVIEKISFTIPTDWVMTAPTEGSFTVTTVDGVTEIAFTGGTQSDREGWLGDFMITPPAHSSADKTIALSIETKDVSNVGGQEKTATAVTVDKPVTITVRPVAEQTTIDSDLDGSNDLTLLPDYAYETSGKEDEWFALGTNTTDAANDGESHDLRAGWSNEDGGEYVYAKLTPTLTASDAGISATGAEFRFFNTKSGQWVTQVYQGTALLVPELYLNSLQVKLPENVSGTLKVIVEALTIDYDEDFADKPDLWDAVYPTVPANSSTVNMATSGSAELTVITFEPVADVVTIGVNSRITSNEDPVDAITDAPKALPLGITVSSSDPSETFDMVLSGIPAGAILLVDGQPYPVTAGSATFIDFQDGMDLAIIPPLHSDTDFTLVVSARSKDGQAVSEYFEKNIFVNLLPVADEADLVLMPAFTVAEGILEANDGEVALSSFVDCR